MRIYMHVSSHTIIHVLVSSMYMYMYTSIDRSTIHAWRGRFLTSWWKGVRLHACNNARIYTYTYKSLYSVHVPSTNIQPSVHALLLERRWSPLGVSSSSHTKFNIQRRPSVCRLYSLAKGNRYALVRYTYAIPLACSIDRHCWKWPFVCLKSWCKDTPHFRTTDLISSLLALVKSSMPHSSQKVFTNT